MCQYSHAPDPDAWQRDNVHRLVANMLQDGRTPYWIRGCGWPKLDYRYVEDSLQQLTVPLPPQKEARA